MLCGQKAYIDSLNKVFVLNIFVWVNFKELWTLKVQPKKTCLFNCLSLLFNYSANSITIFTPDTDVFNKYHILDILDPSFQR